MYLTEHVKSVSQAHQLSLWQTLLLFVMVKFAREDSTMNFHYRLKINQIISDCAIID